jgi:hypothetical protein
MTDESMLYIRAWTQLHRTHDKTYSSYYHFVVATGPALQRVNPPNDRLIAAAYEDVCSPNSPLWNRKDMKDALCFQCEQAKPLYEAAKARLSK